MAGWNLGGLAFGDFLGVSKSALSQGGLWISSVFSLGYILSVVLVFRIHPSYHTKTQVRQRSGYCVRLSSSQCSFTSRDVLCPRYTELINPPSHSPIPIQLFVVYTRRTKKRTWVNKEQCTKALNNTIHKAERSVGKPITYLKS